MNHVADERKYEPTKGQSRDVAGKSELDDEVLPNKGEPQAQEGTGGERYDTAGEHGDMAPEAAESIGEKVDKEKDRVEKR